MSISGVSEMRLCIWLMTLVIASAQAFASDQNRPVLVTQSAGDSTDRGTVYRLEFKNVGATDITALSYLVTCRKAGVEGRPVNGVIVFEFTPPAAATGALRPGTAKAHQIRVPGKYDACTVDADYVLFGDESEWGPDAARLSGKIQGMLQGWHRAFEYLGNTMKQGGLAAVERQLTAATAMP